MPIRLRAKRPTRTGDETERDPVLVLLTVFNVEQIDGLPAAP